MHTVAVKKVITTSMAKGESLKGSLVLAHYNRHSKLTSPHIVHMANELIKKIKIKTGTCKRCELWL